MNFHGRDRFCPECKHIKPTDTFVTTWPNGHKREICAECAKEVEEEKAAEPA